MDSREALERSVRNLLAQVGGLRAEARLALNANLTQLLSAYDALKPDANEQAISEFKRDLETLRKDVTARDHQQAYAYLAAETRAPNSARR